MRPPQREVAGERARPVVQGLDRLEHLARVVGRTFACPFRTRETVATPTPARVATSAIVA